MTISLSVATETAAQRLSNVQTSLSREPVVSLVIPLLNYTGPPWEEWRGTVKALEPLSTDRGAAWKESLYEDGLQHRKEGDHGAMSHPAGFWEYAVLAYRELTHSASCNPIFALPVSP